MDAENLKPSRAATAVASATLLVLLSTGAPTPSGAGVFLTSVTHVPGYDGTGGELTVVVCIDSTSPYLAEMQIPLRNAVSTINALQPTLGNVLEGAANEIPADAFDLESSLLSQLGRCLGLDVSAVWGYTRSTLGSNGSYDHDPGPDLVPGTGDDLRGDDVNLHWFRTSNNDPFFLADPVDSSTYSLDVATLPPPDTFAACATADVAVAMGYPPTESVMVGLGTDRVRRTLSADDVATLRYAMSGLDEIAGTTDDYTFRLEIQEQSASCDIILGTSGGGGTITLWSYPTFPDDHRAIFSCFLSLGDVTFFFNTADPCSQSRSLTAGQWSMISLPCSAAGADTVADVFGDDLDLAGYGDRWGVFARDAVAQSYRLMGTGDALDEGTGYWIKTLDAGQSVSLSGDWNRAIEVPLVADPAAGRANLVGHPYSFEVCWRDARVIDGADLLTLDEADPLIGSVRACSMVPPDPSCVMSRVGHKWNGAAYAAFDGVTSMMQGSLETFDSLWVKAFRPGVALRLPPAQGLGCSFCAPQPVADAGPNRTICSGDTVTLGTPAQPGFTYSWSPGGETTAQIDVSPVAATTYTVTATSNCGSAQDSVEVQVVIGPGLDETFEGDVSGWTATGLWHLADDTTCWAYYTGYTSPTHAFSYADEATCFYDFGTNSGTLTSPPITGISDSSQLSFRYMRQAEFNTFYDRCEVNIVHAGGTDTVLQLTANAFGFTWPTAGPISLADYAGQTIQVQFSFDTVDSAGNDYRGWLIDDVVVGPGCDAGAGAVSPAAAPVKVPAATASGGPHDWALRLVAEAGELRDPDNVLGRLADALDGYDYHDLEEPPPFGERYLSIVFPHEDWGDQAGDYTSDFQAVDSADPRGWRFDVLGADLGAPVTLSWQGPVAAGTYLVDDATGEWIPVSPSGSYTFLLQAERRSFRWLPPEAVANGLLFRDGFESGDVSAWSGASGR